MPDIEVAAQPAAPKGKSEIIGIIYPPPEMKNIIDKTAQFIAKKPELEAKLKENEGNSPRFQFLLPTDAYHAYYRMRIEEFREGKATLQESKQDEGPAREVKPVPVKPPPKEPAPYDFTYDNMPIMSAQDLDIIKLTAQFVARNGRAFLSQLSVKEARNFQFEFLRPTHSLFGFFTRLVEQYTKVLIPPKGIEEKLKNIHDDKFGFLNRCMERMEWEIYVAEKRKKAEEEEAAEKAAYASIDWHDFVVVQSIEFTEADDAINLPPPIDFEQLKSMSLMQRYAASLSLMPAPSEEKQNDDMEMDMEEDDKEEAKPSQPLKETAPSAPTKAVEPPKVVIPDHGKVKIRSDYVPQAKLGIMPGKQQNLEEKCAVCGQLIPVSEMTEHIRIELLDPKWREQRKVVEERQKTSNLLQGDAIGKNLQQMAENRTDIFGDVEVEIGKKAKEHEEALKRKEKEMVIWDGHTNSIQMATRQAQERVTNEDRLNYIKQISGAVDENKLVGPKIPGAPEPQANIPRPPMNFPSGGGPMMYMPGAGFQAMPAPPTGFPASAGMYPPQYPPQPSGYPQYGGLPGYPQQAGPPIGAPFGTPGVMPFGQGIPPLGMIPPVMPGMIPMQGSMLGRDRPGLEPGDERDSKRSRVDEDGGEAGGDTSNLIPEEQWLSQNPGPYTVKVVVSGVPNYGGAPEFNLESLDATMKVEQLKKTLAERINLASGKQKLSLGSIVLKNTATLAYYNISSVGSELSLTLKERGKK